MSFPFTLLPPLLLLLSVGRAHPPSGPGAADELGRQLELFSADRAQVRDRAERYVAGHVRIEDYPRLAQLAVLGDAEVRTRLARVIGAGDRNLELAALFLAERDEALQTVGEEALTRRLLEWNPALARRGLVGEPLQKRVREAAKATYPHTVRIELGGPLVDRCSSLQRSTGMPMGITIAPQLFDRDPIRAASARFDGHWLNALFLLARVYGIGLEVHGLPRRENEDQNALVEAGAFLRFAPLSDLGARSGLQLVLQWFRTLSVSEDALQRQRAAHNLARTGWPGALAWMQRLAVKRSDGAAWEGLLVAAAHGRRVPMLLQPEALAHTLARIEQRLERAEPGVQEALQAFFAAYREAGCLRSDESSLEQVLCGSWEGMSAGGKALRLALLEATGCGDVFGLSRARAVASDASAPAALRWQALSTAVHVASVRGVEAAPPAWPEPERMLGALSRPAEIALAVTLLDRAGISPPAEWSSIGAEVSRATGESKAAFLLWWLAADQPDIAASFLIELLETEETQVALNVLAATATAGRFAVHSSTDLARMFDRARQRTETGGLSFELERTAMLLGVSSPEAFFGALSSAERVEFLDPKDFALWGAIGAFGGVPAAFEARVSLLGELREAISRGGDARRFGGLVRALEDTLQGLFQRGEDSTAGAFFEEIRQISFRSPETGLARALGLGWPPPSKVHLRVLGASPAAERLRELYGL